MDKNATLILAENVRRLMDDQGLTHKSLAARAGLSSSNIGYLVNYKDVNDRHPTSSTIEGVARALGLMPWMLFVPDLPLDSVRVRPAEQLARGKAAVAGSPPAASTSHLSGLDRGTLTQAVKLLRGLVDAHNSHLPDDVFADSLADLYGLLIDDSRSVPGKVVEIAAFLAERARKDGGSADGSAGTTKRNSRKAAR